MKTTILIIVTFAAACFANTTAMLSFNAGQVSPKLEARTNFAKYKSACRQVENMFVKVQGSAMRRSGTRYIEAAKEEGRLISFEYSMDDTYIIELGNGYMRFYRDDGL